MISNVFDRISFWSLYLVIVLLPVFFIPFTKIPAELSKDLLLVTGLISSVIFYSIARYKDKQMTFPKSLLLLSGAVVLIVLFISSMNSGFPRVSLFGVMFDFGSFFFIFASFVLMLMSALVLRTPKSAKTVLLGLILSTMVLFVFQAIRLFAPGLTLGLLSMTDKTENLIGSWYTFGTFVGFFSVISLFIIEFFPIPKSAKYILGVFMTFSILLLAVINLPLLWALLGIFALLVMVYKLSLSFHKKEAAENEVVKKPFPVVSTIVFVLSVVLFLSHSFGAFIPNYLKISNVDVSPSFGATMGVTKSVLSAHPVFGVGPNKFSQAWSLYKPVEINGSQFWNTSFDFGRGLFPTFFATTGYAGIVAWLLFLIMFLYVGGRALFSSIKNNMNLEMSGFFIGALFLFTTAFFYSTGQVLFLLALAFTGIFIGLYSSSRENAEKLVVFSSSPFKSFSFLAMLIIVCVVSLGLGFKYLKSFASVPFFRSALFASDVTVAEPAITKAVSLNSNDLYLRYQAQVYLYKFNALATKTTALTDAEKTELQNTLAQTVDSSIKAVNYNPANYLNFQMLGSIYQSVGQLGVKDSYGNAETSYQSAILLNPFNPGLRLSLSRVYFADGKIKEAETSAKEALTLKADYPDALVTLAQISKSEGNTSDASKYAQAALSYVQASLAIYPNDQNIQQQIKDLTSYINSLKNSPAPVVEKTNDTTIKTDTKDSKDTKDTKTNTKTTTPKDTSAN